MTLNRGIRNHVWRENVLSKSPWISRGSSTHRRCKYIIWKMQIAPPAMYVYMHVYVYMWYACWRRTFDSSTKPGVAAHKPFPLECRILDAYTYVLVCTLKYIYIYIYSYYYILIVPSEETTGKIEKTCYWTNGIYNIPTLLSCIIPGLVPWCPPRGATLETCSLETCSSIQRNS